MSDNPLENLFANNRAWSASMHAENPDFFSRLVNQQSPEYLWIGCSDSRVPANQIIGLAPGEVFVHRNIGNVVVHTDLNALSVIHYAVDMLRVKHILVVGHYGCGGVKAALNDNRTGLTDNWLRHVQDVRDRHEAILAAISAAAALCVSDDDDTCSDASFMARAARVSWPAACATLCRFCWKRASKRLSAPPMRPISSSRATGTRRVRSRLASTWAIVRSVAASPRLMLRVRAKPTPPSNRTPSTIDTSDSMLPRLAVCRA